ncbi:MAG TPA: hypothetical protein VE129_05040 [Thermoanaerobaculia bacterium]|nr:hypothetical protein [Thermoanaerobaculia bacterium]
MTRVLFVEGKDEAALLSFAQGLALPWRLLARCEQGLFLLEVTHPAGETERAASALANARAWTFVVVDEHPGG